MGCGPDPQPRQTRVVIEAHFTNVMVHDVMIKVCNRGVFKSIRRAPLRWKSAQEGRRVMGSRHGPTGSQRGRPFIF